ncbi:hypothetical protein BJY16_003093 [Actinoplanes octamycinicus]|uniref:Dolichyl-phosphate-mannose-protein mannosyltransferase n=1 Tax=Actinoplanes octamycinicus TaxID=135948 RepID=A0A7W7GWL6_9ACTN|nr:hypothetical protein [Actinoplanes octamycinicus]MBB4739634.1 hypothetical protein [Actinoplanes octamycinicus]GIE54817.1 hypothetical protein Aoc01nite_02190 [Actinoplanes octamycinicus]
MWARHRREAAIALLAAVLGGVYLAAPRMGSDLAAQVGRAEFFAAHGWAPVDLRWYAGVNQLGYSLVSQPVMAWLGVRVTGVVSLVTGSVLLLLLFRRTGGTRLRLAGLLGVAGLAGNLVSGRITYGLGVCLGLAALLALTYLPRRSAAVAAAVLAALASATSPVVALFLGLAGTALLLSGWVSGVSRVPRAASEPADQVEAARHPHQRVVHSPAAGDPASASHCLRGAPLGGWGLRRWGSHGRGLRGWGLRGRELPGRELPGQELRNGRPLLIAGPAAALIALNALLFGDGGWMNISRTDTLHAVLTGLLVAALVPVRPVRIGALLSSAGVLAAALVHTPVGLNATRLAVMFALPVLAAYAKLPDRVGKRTATAGIAGILALTAWWQPPVVTADLRDLGNPAADPDYFRPLTDRLAAEPLTGRVEIPPTRAYWEAARLGDVPLARGWLRQADIDRNPLFFTTVPGAAGTGVPLSAGTYRLWLAEQAVQFVAVPDAELSWSGRAEAELVTAGLPYLTPVWSGAHWRLYAVADPQPIVAAPATLVRHTAAAVTLDAPAAGDVRVRVRWSRWLTGSGGASVRRDGDWTILRVPGPGRYTLSS